jgi:CheY-like chemotaxis protein
MLVEVLPVAARRILIVEDETMIAMMIEDFLTELGWDVVALVGSLDRALAMARDADIDAAVLDVNLNGQDSFAAADVLWERNIPFVFATGYGSDGITDRFPNVPVLTKPFHRDDLDRALCQAMSVTGDFPRSQAPTDKTAGP